MHDEERSEKPSFSNDKVEDENDIAASCYMTWAYKIVTALTKMY